MRLALVAIVALALAVAVSASEPRRVLEHKAVRVIPVGWTGLGIAEPSQTLTLSLALTLRNTKNLEDRFWAVSNPASPFYTEYSTLEELRERYAPSPKTLARITAFLEKHNAENIQMTLSADWVSFTINVSNAESMFATKFARFRHSSGSEVIRSLLPYSLPVSISSDVAFVSGMHRFPRASASPIASFGQPLKRQFGDAVTPQVIWKTYRTNGTQGKASNNLQSVAQFLGQYFDPNDLAQFQKAFKLPSMKVQKVVGPNHAGDPGIEATLDIEYITATAPLVPTWFWSTGGLHEGQENFVLWAQALNNASLIPFVNSVSYGDSEDSVTEDYMTRLDQEFQKLALRGVSILFASGDNGVGCHKSSCVNEPNWPASSPYVTTVGGFVYAKGQAPTGDTISSGGFSNFYSRPSYQDAAVQAYLSKSGNLPPKSQFNATGRAMPDVSSYSENVIVVQGGGQEPVAGTSCAAPVFAGIISLVNDALLQSGKKTVGFLNPALYGFGASSPQAFIDVTSGNNQFGCCNGFQATNGWDAITGWGGPNFPELLQAFQSAQAKKL